MACELLYTDRYDLPCSNDQENIVMKTRTAFGSILATAVACLGLSTPAFATLQTQTIDLGKVFTGSTPDGTPWWLEATFKYNDDGSSNTGTLDLKANLGPDFVGQGGFNGLGFYLSGNTLDSATYVSGTKASTVKIGTYTAPPNGMGDFSLNFQWTANTFNGSDTAEYTLAFDNMLTTSPFVANTDGWLAYAHVQGILNNTPGGATCSGWIVAGEGTVGEQDGPCGGTPPPHNVPEPGALGMFGLGVLLIGGFVTWRRRNYA